MRAKVIIDPWWAALAVWGVVNAVNVLQAAGFLSRVYTGTRDTNRILGYVIVTLVVPAFAALITYWRAGAGWLQLAGPALFLAFVLFMIVVEDIWQVEFRSPMRYDVLVPYLLLFFGSIFLMGLPMFRLNRRLWLVTVATTVMLLGSMVVAIRRGVG